MAGSNINQNTFLHGELDPSTHGATDSELYNHGLAICKNTYIQQTGSLFRRPGSQTIYIYSGNDDQTYLRKFFTMYDTSGTPRLVAFSIKRLELFSLSDGLQRSVSISFLDINTWNKGFSVQVIHGKNYLFCDKGIYTITIIGNIANVDKVQKIISPQTLSNRNKESYLKISNFADERYEAKITFVNDDDIPNNAEHYLTFFVDTQRSEVKTTINQGISDDNLMTINVTYFVVCKIVGKMMYEDNTLLVRFMPAFSSFTDWKIFKTFEGRRIYKYTKPIEDINPRKTCIYKGRFWMLDDERQGVHATSLNSSFGDDYLDFTRGVEDTDGLFYTFPENVGELLWITSSDQGLFVGTTTGVFVCDTQVPTPSNVNFRLFSNSIPSSLEPLIVNSSIFFIDDAGKQVFEIAKDEISGAFKTYPISQLSQHLLNPGVVSIAYSAYPASLLCCVLQNGTFLFMGYNKSSDIYAWTRHELGGNNAHVNSVGVYKYKGHDFFIMDVTRALDDGTQRRSIEYFSNDFSLAPSDKYEFNYLDSSRSSARVARITGLKLGQSPRFQFSVAPDDIRNSQLLLTSSDNTKKDIPLIISTWRLSEDNKTLYNISADLSASLTTKISPNGTGEMYQLRKTSRIQIRFLRNHNVLMRIQVNKSVVIRSNTPIIITSNAWVQEKENFVSTDGNVKKFILKFLQIDGDYAVYQLLHPDGKKVQHHLAMEYSFAITNDGIWYSLGYGVFYPGKNTLINYEMIRNTTLNYGVGTKDACTLTQIVPYGFIANCINISSVDKIGAVASSHILYTRYNKYKISGDDIILIDDITEDNDIEKVRIIVRKKNEKRVKVLNCERGEINEQETIITRDFVEKLYKVKLDNGYKYIVISPTAIYKAKENLGNWLKVCDLENEERVINVCNNSLICTTHYVRFLEKKLYNNKDKIAHPLSKAIRCACVSDKLLWIGGKSGALLVTKKLADKFYHVKHNRNFTIEAMYVNSLRLNCLSAYGEVLSITSGYLLADRDYNDRDNTVTIADRTVHRNTGLSEAQFYYFEDKLFMLGERECVCEICKGEDIFIIQKKSPILIKDIKSFDKLNNIIINPIDNNYNATTKKGTLSIPARVETERYVYDPTLIGNGNIYFKVYSINSLSMYLDEKLQVTCDGFEIKEKVVTRDHISVPDGGYVLRCGYGYAQEIVTLDLSGGSVKGSSVGLIARQFTLCLRVLGSTAGRYSTDGLRWYSIPYKGMLAIDRKQSEPYSGIIKMTMPNGVEDINTRVLHLYNKKAEPLNVLSITRDTYVSDN